MTDIVERLREGVFGTDETKTDAVIHSHMQAAADEIERLRAECQRLADEVSRAHKDALTWMERAAAGPDVVARLRNPSTGSPRWATTMEDAAAAIEARDAEIARQAAEIASLRLTLGGRTFSATAPEPIGCPAPGMCVQVAEIARLRAECQRLADEVSRAHKDALTWMERAAAADADIERLRASLLALTIHEEATARREGLEPCYEAQEARALLEDGR